MNKVALTIATLGLVVGTTAFAENNIGSCGWGSKIFDGQKGVIPQVLAVTTNGTSGNQTFAISSGTSGCTQNGVVTSSWKTALFIDSNMNRLAKDMSVGQGESLSSLASLLGVESADKALFFKETKANFAYIFSNENVSSQEVAHSLNVVLAGNTQLAKYAIQG